MMNNNLDRLEAQLRSLFEDKLIKALTGKSTSDDLINQLIQAMQTNLNKTPEGYVLAADRYYLEVSPEDLGDWEVYQTYLNDIAIELSEWGIREEYRFATYPTLQFVVNENFQRDEWQIRAEFSVPGESLPDTAALESIETIPEEDLIPANAYIVIGGKTNYPLNKVLVNIGRHSENDLVIEDQYMSRHHAQLRAINNRYVIFDVGSTGGILLNGKPITQATLHPGDVIHIGMTHLIYVQDTTGDLPTSVLPGHSESGENV